MRCLPQCLPGLPKYRRALLREYLPRPDRLGDHPHLQGLQEWKHLSAAATLCGACTETCPVGIDLHHHLLRNRRNAAKAQPDALEQRAYQGFAFVMTRPKLYRQLTHVAPFLQRLHKLINGRRIDPLYGWTQSRNFPEVQPRTFKDYWASRQEIKP